ncbi:MAG TPA: hypothetical protein DEO49_01530 [Sutterella sp.]|nr:hypothetical protein [Sutterella sp.]
MTNIAPQPCSFSSLRPLAKRLRLTPMLEHAMELNQDEISGWSASQLLQVLFSEEVSRREEGALKRRIQDANLTYADACYSRIDWSKDRQLNQAKVNSLFSLDWVRRHQNCIITGSTGCGKTWMANAIAHHACMEGFRVRSYRLPLLLREMARFQTIQGLKDHWLERLQELSRIDLIHFDDWAIATLDACDRKSLYEIINHCSGETSFLITSVPPVEVWANFIGDPTISDSILDRLVPAARRLAMTGASLRAKEEYGGIPAGQS